MYSSFPLMLLVSALVHAVAFVWYGWGGDMPPGLMAVQRGRMSIQVQASLAASPASDPLLEQPTESIMIEAPMPLPQPSEPVVAMDMPALPGLKLPPPQLTPPPPPKLEVPRKPPETETVRPERKPEKHRSESADQVASRASPGSQVSAGADAEESPQIYSNPSPPYPPDALAARLEGRVLLHAIINANGHVETAWLHQSSGVASFDESALWVVKRWRFHPGRRSGVAVSMEVEVPVRFEIRYR